MSTATSGQRSRNCWPGILIHAEQYYAASNEVEHLKLAMRPLRRLYGEELTSEFGPRKLEHLREVMIAEGLTRQGVNKSPETVSGSRHRRDLPLGDQARVQEGWHPDLGARCPATQCRICHPSPIWDRCGQGCLRARQG